MCGRFSLTAEDFELKERFGVEVDSNIYTPRYNAAPSQKLAVISNDNPEQLSFYRWGLIPYWAKDPSIGYKLINARAETAAEKPSFRQAIKQRRCLVPANGFFEWKQDGNKQPYFFHLNQKELFAFAGLWESWKDAEDKEIRSFTILTTNSNETMQGIHHRMPVILPREKEQLWLDVSNEVPEEVLKPFDSEEMDRYAVSSFVNKPVNDSPEILKPQEETGSLF
ncbi:MAG: SOS response-associated peptidase [Bacteroidales bacterium]|nr:SOS response-associated peptidase [Bacteroidales bacterium]